jgi:hypothetical protein
MVGPAAAPYAKSITRDAAESHRQRIFAVAIRQRSKRFTLVGVPHI